MRRIVLAALTAAVLLVPALGAGAKVPGEVFIEGNDLDLHLVGDDAFEFPELVGFVGVHTEVPEPTGELGSRYTLRYVGFMPPREVVQHLYPYAEAGPVLFTPAGQRWGIGPGGRAPSGWAQAEPLLIEWLEARGLRPPPPAAVTAPAPSVVPPRGSVPLALLALGGLMTAAAAFGLRARRAELARDVS